MTSPTGKRTDLSWRAGNLAALAASCTLGASLLAAWAGGGRAWLDAHPAELQARIDAADEKLDPNLASEASLQRLPGLGPQRTHAIVEYRQAHPPRPFRYADDLQRVKGIGPVIVEELRGHLCLPPRIAN